MIDWKRDGAYLHGHYKELDQWCQPTFHSHSTPEVYRQFLQAMQNQQNYWSDESLKERLKVNRMWDLHDIVFVYDTK